MSKLENNLKEWVSLQLISSEQATRILNHENVKPERSWIAYTFLVLGIVTACVGIISLIAANWAAIPDAWKLTADFSLLICTGMWIVQTADENHSLKFEMLLIFFILLCLASIGLIGQIYQTGGQFHQALLLWSLITFPAALAASDILIPCLCVGAFLTGSSFEIIRLIPSLHYHPRPIIMAVPLFCVAAVFVIRIFSSRDIFIRAFRIWTVISGLAAILYAEIDWILILLTGPPLWTRPPFWTGHPYAVYMPVYTLAGFVAFVILMEKDYRKNQKCILLLTLGLFLLSFNLQLTGIESETAHGLFTLLELGLISLFWASLKWRRLFQWFVFLVGLRFLVFYFQALGGLAVTGAGLIVSGGLIIAMTVLWSRYRTTLAAQAERWIQ